MKTNTFLILSCVVAGLLLRACAARSNATATPEMIAVPEPDRAAQQMRLKEHLHALSNAKAYIASNDFVIENVLGDAADGTPSTRIEVAESLRGGRHEIFVTVGDQMRQYVADLSGQAPMLFVKGPSPDLGVTDKGWYSTRDRAIIDDRLNAMPSRVLFSFLPDPDALEPAFGQPGVAVHDAVACNEYSAPGDALPAATLAPLQRMFSRADAFEVRIALCDDGLPHLLRITGSGLGTSDTRKPASIEITLQFSYNDVPATTVPTDVQPLDADTADAQSAPTPAPDPTTQPSQSQSEAPAAAGKPDLTNMNDGSYGTDEPMVGIVTDLMPVSVNTEKDELSYVSAVPLKQLFDYYHDVYSQRGLTEREFVTSVFDNGFSIVFDGLPGGRSMVVQATTIAPERTTVIISNRKE